MLISMNWISDFVDLKGIDIYDLINRFTLSTAEVEGIEEYGKEIQDVVAGKILKVLPHEDSKKLHIVIVDIGGETVQCICGAPNVREGITVPFAKNGGSVSGMKIERKMLAGVESNGMCCSEKELGISDDHSGLMILDDSIQPGTDIKTFMEIEDIVFEVDNKSLTNRPDLWGHYGIAREIAALAGRKLQDVSLYDMEACDNLPDVSIKIEDPDKCYRYSSVIIKNITQKVSPVNMRIRLYYCGMRAINLLADLTNYLMLELGQPMHAFNHRLVNNIVVKTFEKEFTFKTLDGMEREIDTDTLMICNGDQPVAIAGIMGGEETEISEDTNSLLLESANFNGVSTRKSSTRLGLRTEASARYEKIIDPELTTLAVKRFAKLLADTDPGVVIASRLTDVYVKHYDEVRLQFTKDYVDRYTGIEISDQQIIETLTSLGFKVTYEKGQFDVIVPSYRATKDVTIKADIIEEITRIYGYDNFVLKTNKSELTPVRHSVQRDNEYMTKQILAERFSLHEVHSYIWYNNKQNRDLGIETEDNVKIVNSVSPESDVLRSSMIPTLLNMVDDNQTSFDEIGIFEIGRVVKGLKGDGTCDEQKSLGIVLASRDTNEKALYFRLKEIIETLGSILKNTQFEYQPTKDEDLKNWNHPVNSARVVYQGQKVGLISVLHPVIRDNIDRKLNIVMAEVDFSAFAEIQEVPKRYQEISKYPGMDIDLSLLMNKEITYAEVSSYIDEYTCKYLLSYELIDVYEDEAVLKDQKSVTIRFHFGSSERTLSSSEVSGFTDDIIELLGSKGIKLR